MNSVVSINNEKKQKKKRKSNDRYKLFFMALPFMLLTFVFSYLPLQGWMYSFFDYRPGIPLSQTRFVGLEWFRSIFSNPVQTGEVLRVIKNTFAISGLNIAVSFLPMLFAIFLSEINVKWFRKGVQIFSTLPNFISWVLIYSIAFTLFSVNGGFVNDILIKLGVIKEGINFLALDDHTWLTMTLWSLWKGLGWGAILYLAAISGIDQELYEVAKVDGAGRFRCIWNITIPGILPTYFVLLLLSVANFANNGMDQYFVFQNAMNKTHIEVLDLYVYNIGLLGANFSFATAVSMLKSLISIVLLFVANKLAKWIRGENII